MTRNGKNSTWYLVLYGLALAQVPSSVSELQDKDPLSFKLSFFQAEKGLTNNHKYVFLSKFHTSNPIKKVYKKYHVDVHYHRQE